MHQNSACSEPSGEQKVVVECVLESPVFGMTSSVIDIHDAAQRGEGRACLRGSTGSSSRTSIRLLFGLRLGLTFYDFDV